MKKHRKVPAWQLEKKAFIQLRKAHIHLMEASVLFSEANNISAMKITQKVQSALQRFTGPC